MQNEVTNPEIDLQSYNKIIIAFSGGKDSLACILNLLEAGVPKSKIELWHHVIDGREGSKLMDWPVTDSYCKAVADALELPIFYSWKRGGFEGELLRENSFTAPTMFETPDGKIEQAGGTSGKKATRLKFPQVSPDLSVRWCSSYLKIDVCANAIRNQTRFNNSRTLVVTGERGEESANRAKYKSFEVDRADGRDGRSGRLVDRFRPVLNWTEAKVWDIIEKYKIRLHPAYYLGFGRVSCAACIFGSANQFATLAEINPAQIERVSNYENQFGLTIKRDKSVLELVRAGVAYKGMNPADIDAALCENYSLPVIMEDWFLPAGAFGESCGSL